MNNTKKPELLIPAGNPEVLRTAVMYGADAVYCGGDSLGLRANADNFSMSELKESIAFAHEHGAKVYVTTNIFARNQDMRGALRFLLLLNNVKPDALIISDPGIFTMAKEVCPDIDIHISTQANSTNFGSFLFWHKLGAKRVVAARELTIDELAEIKTQIPEDMELEAFVHGAMCISYSGRCLISSYLNGRDANRGDCTHPCRWKYALMEESRPGEYFPVNEDDGGTTLYSSKDLNMVGHIPELVGAGIDSFKVEGRMKTALYVASVTAAYRRAIDEYFEDPEKYKENIPQYEAEVRKCTTRPFTTGFYFGQPEQTVDGPAYYKGAVYLGTIRKDEEGKLYFIQKNKFSVGYEIEVMSPGKEPRTVTVKSLLNEAGEYVETCPHPEEKLYPDLGIELQEYDIMRKIN